MFKHTDSKCELQIEVGTILIEVFVETKLNEVLTIWISIDREINCSRKNLQVMKTLFKLTKNADFVSDVSI